MAVNARRVEVLDDDLPNGKLRFWTPASSVSFPFNHSLYTFGHTFFALIKLLKYYLYRHDVQMRFPLACSIYYSCLFSARGYPSKRLRQRRVPYLFTLITPL